MCARARVPRTRTRRRGFRAGDAGEAILARAEFAGGVGGNARPALPAARSRASAGGLGFLNRAEDDDDAASAERTIGSVLRRIGRDISWGRRASYRRVEHGRRRANWLEALASVLVQGAETGRCPALDPRD